MSGAAAQAGGSERLAGPWARCWAKLIDLWLAAAVIFALWIVYQTKADTASGVIWIVGRAARDQGNDLLQFTLFLLFIAATFLLDALVQFTFGVTPGLALVGARLQREDHRRLSLGQALGRNLYVWVFGFWICIGWYPMWFYYVELVEHRLPRWDRRFGTRVFDHGGSYPRSAFAGACYAAQVIVCLWLLDRFKV